MTDVMAIIYEGLRQKVVAGIESYKHMRENDQLAKKFAAATDNAKQKEAAMNTFHKSSATTRNFGKSVINDFVIAEDVANRILALDPHKKFEALPTLSFIEDKQLLDYYPLAKQKHQEEEKRKRGNAAAQMPGKSAEHVKLRSKVLQLRSEYASCVTRYMEAEKNQQETQEKLAEIEKAMEKFPLKEQKSEKYFAIEKERLLLLSQLGKLNSLVRKMSSDMFLKETSFVINNGELLAYYGERFSIDDIKEEQQQQGEKHQNDHVSRERIRNKTLLLEELDKTHMAHESSLQKATKLFRQVEQRMRSKNDSVDEHEMSRLISECNDLQSQLDEKEDNYNYILSKIRIAYNILQRHQAKLNESQRAMIKEQMQELNARSNLNQSTFVPVEQESYQTTARMCVDKLLKKREEILKKIAMNKRTLDRLTSEVIERSNSSDFEEMACIQEEVETIDRENSELIETLNDLREKLLQQVEDVKKNPDRVDRIFYDYVDNIYKELMGVPKNVMKQSSRIPVRTGAVPKVSVSKVMKPKPKTVSPKGRKKEVIEVAKLLQQINDNPLMKNECQLHLDRFYDELKKIHKKRIGCTKITSDIARDRDNAAATLKSHLLNLLRQ